MPEATEHNQHHATMPTANEHHATNRREAAQHAAVPSEADDPVQAASDKLHAVLTVLRGVQDMRYDRTHLALREAMRQTALAAIEDALTDLHEAKQRSR